jgi:hypothetical protein
VNKFATIELRAEGQTAASVTRWHVDSLTDVDQFAYSTIACINESLIRTLKYDHEDKARRVHRAAV